MMKGYDITDRRAAARSIIKLIKRGFDDETTLRMIVKYLNRYQFTIKSGRECERASCLSQLLHNVPSNYLDYGCGDGSITVHVSKSFGLNKKNVLGVDIKDIDNPDITFIGTRTDSVQCSSVDLVTAFVSLHHAEIDIALDTIERVLKPGGVLVIREHDFDGSKILRMYLDLIHMFISVRVHGDSNLSRHGRPEYKSMNEWDNLIISRGFECGKTLIYKSNNPQRLYCRAYVKK
jgi:SAM-dependent methyltransferase